MYQKNKTNDTILATKKLKFIKGIETGSKVYQTTKSSGNVAYYRVGDMNSLSSQVYVDTSYLKQAESRIGDILISFDGAPGRVGYTIEGCFSGSLRKIECRKMGISKGYIFFWSISDQIQQCINEHSFGTTILHASKSLNYLQIDEIINISVNNELNYIYELMINNVLKIKHLSLCKKYLLKKFFS